MPAPGTSAAVAGPGTSAAVAGPGTSAAVACPGCVELVPFHRAVSGCGATGEIPGVMAELDSLESLFLNENKLTVSCLAGNAKEHVFCPFYAP